MFFAKEFLQLKYHRFFFSASPAFYFKNTAQDWTTVNLVIQSQKVHFYDEAIGYDSSSYCSTVER